MHKLPQPVKLWYWGPFFRHEAPQAGRFRQFTQVGAEALGSDDPSLDAELILLLGSCSSAPAPARCACACRASGSPDTRARLPRTSCATTCVPGRTGSPTTCATRLDQNPLRAFDSDHPGTQARHGGSAPAARPAERRGRRALRRGARAARRRGPRVRGRLRRSCAGSTTTRARCSSSSAAPGRAERAGRRRALRPAGGGARRPAHAGGGLGRRASSASCSPPASRGAGTRPVLRGAGQARRPREAFAWLAGCARDGLRVEIEQAGRSLQGPAEAGRPHRRARDVIVGDGLRACGTWTAASSATPRTPTRPCAAARDARRESARAPTATAPSGRAAARRATWASGCAWPAGCTAGATTAA